MTEDKAPEQTVTSEPIEIEATIFPKYNICSIEIDQGQKKLKFEGIPVPTQIKELVYHSHNNRVLLTAPNPKGYKPRCHIRGAEIELFNETVRELDIENQWLLVAKPTNGAEYEPELLIKQHQDPSNIGKKIRIVFGQRYIEIKPNYSSKYSYDVLLDGETVELSGLKEIEWTLPMRDGSTILAAVIKYVEPKSVEILLVSNGMKVWYGRDSVDLEIALYHRGAMTGLCGNGWNGNRVGINDTPQKFRFQ